MQMYKHFQRSEAIPLSQNNRDHSLIPNIPSHCIPGGPPGIGRLASV